MIIINKAMRQRDRLVWIDLVKGGIALGQTLEDVCQLVCRERGQAGVLGTLHVAHPQHTRGL